MHRRSAGSGGGLHGATRPIDRERRGDPRGRPSRDPIAPAGRAVAHPESGTASLSFARGGVPRPGGVPSRPERGHRETGMGDDKRRPYARTTRRRGPRRGDPRGRPSRDPIAPAGRAVAHPESGTASLSFARGGVPRPGGVPCRPERGHREAGVGDDKRRPYARTTRRRGPRRGDPRGRPSRDPIAPAGRAVAHPESGTASLSFARGGVPRPGGVPSRPERGHRETGMGDDTSATRPA